VGRTRERPVTDGDDARNQEKPGPWSGRHRDRDRTARDLLDLSHEARGASPRPSSPAPTSFTSTCRASAKYVRARRPQVDQRAPSTSPRVARSRRDRVTGPRPLTAPTRRRWATHRGTRDPGAALKPAATSPLAISPRGDGRQIGETSPAPHLQSARPSNSPWLQQRNAWLIGIEKRVHVHTVIVTPPSSRARFQGADGHVLRRVWAPARAWCPFSTKQTRSSTGPVRVLRNEVSTPRNSSPAPPRSRPRRHQYGASRRDRNPEADLSSVDYAASGDARPDFVNTVDGQDARGRLQRHRTPAGALYRSTTPDDAAQSQRFGLNPRSFPGNIIPPTGSDQAAHVASIFPPPRAGNFDNSPRPRTARWKERLHRPHRYKAARSTSSSSATATTTTS